MKRSKFSLSHYNLFSCDPGELIPCGITEVLPGDTIQQNTSALIRCSPLLAPVMHPVHARIHHWFVPHRLVFPDFEKFITGGPDGMDDTEFPTITFATKPGVGSLADYLGINPEVDGITVSALPFRGYALIFNEWYRDQDLQAPLALSTDPGADTTTSKALQNVGWEKDYFTSARPWEQKGPSISIPLGDYAPVVGLAKGNDNVGGTRNGYDYNGLSSWTGQTLPTDANFYMQTKPDGTPNVRADLSGVSAITVNALREAMALQRFEEARARFGSRYVEYLRYLNVRSSDARLQRPEYLGGANQTIQFSEVLQTAEGDNPVGEMRGHGIGAMRSNRYRRFIEEHGYVYTFLTVKPRTMYAQGIPRHFNRRTKEDFWQKELQHIGQQEILKKEIWAASSDPNGTFGFQDRYDEYRRNESRISGEFRTTMLDHWHMCRLFDSEPALNASFVRSNPTERVFAVPSQDTLYIMANHSIQARRLVAKTGSSFIY